jgi:hypothetical protein
MLKATTFRHSAKRYAVPQCEFAKDAFFRVGVCVVKRLGPHSGFRNLLKNDFQRLFQGANE